MKARVLVDAHCTRRPLSSALEVGESIERGTMGDMQSSIIPGHALNDPIPFF